MSETPRTWTLEGEPNEEHGGPGALTWRVNGATPERDRERIRAIELEPTLDLLKHAYLRPDDPYAHPQDPECGCEDCEREAQIVTILREHGRLSGGDGS